MSLPREEYDLPSMTARERFQHVCRIFDEARELPDGDARRDFLIRVCGDDESLRLEVEAMLAAHESSSDPDSLEVLPAAAELIEAMEPPPTEVIPSEVGKYKIRRLLGSGSVGTVYEAEERNPHRRVALKFLSHEFASSEVHDRFRDAELIHTAFTPHAPYSVSDATFARVRTLADELDIPVHSHIHETAGEVEDSVREFGELAARPRPSGRPG